MIVGYILILIHYVSYNFIIEIGRYLDLHNAESEVPTLSVFELWALMWVCIEV